MNCITILKNNERLKYFITQSSERSDVSYFHFISSKQGSGEKAPILIEFLVGITLKIQLQDFSRHPVYGEFTSQ